MAKGASSRHPCLDSVLFGVGEHAVSALPGQGPGANDLHGGSSWVLYDRAFWRRAEVTKDLNWLAVNTSLFNLCFGGRAQRRSICQLCLSEQHTSQGCPRRVVAIYRAPLPSCSVGGSNSAQQLSLTVASHSASIAPSANARTRTHGDLQTIQH